MTTTISLKTYNSPQSFLDAISPTLISDWEWRAHFPLGLVGERVQNPNPLDSYVATWIGGSLQLLIFRYHGPTPIVITAARPTEDLQNLAEQLKLLAEWAAAQPKEILDAYTQVDGPEEFTEPFTSLLTEKLGWPKANIVARLRGSYVDRDLFVPHPRAEESHIIRPCTTKDNVEDIAKLVQDFQRDTSRFHPSVSSLEDAVKLVAPGIAKGSYWGYFLQDGKIAAMAMLRRPTANGIGLTLVVTGSQYRRRGYGSAVTSAAVEHALWELGKSHVSIFWEEDGGAERIYRKLGFSTGYGRQAWKFAAM